MRIALEQAQIAFNNSEVPVGAVVVNNNHIVGVGHNRSVMDADPSAHAEVIAMRSAAQTTGNYRLDASTLYVTIEPCLMCCGALLQARIQRLVFGAREPRTGAVVSQFDSLMLPGHTHHVAIDEGPLADDCSALMQKFFQANR